MLTSVGGGVGLLKLGSGVSVKVNESASICLIYFFPIRLLWAVHLEKFVESRPQLF